MNVSGNKHIVGSLELCDLPELSIIGLNVRVDTGAATSSLHVDNIDDFERDGESWVSFDIHPDIHQVSKIVRREVKVEDVRKIKSSTATREKRYVITTTIVLAGMSWPIQLTLTDRSEMSYLMLLGREAMQGRLIVDPEHEYLLTKNNLTP
ncbi:ATP-dependent zinc protease family protein [Paraglaciecola hydrolytica]|uniref:Ribosomal protein S6 modification protein n=1 Tax=Paraglaciecola hydrolytica TaxID=1799789 RepID=A0A136A362_9ALTE|nr:RimK/LysX family protein [Paraglaciecola hydrolytica]KXI29644.1 ribosomal protein S6 modification protein [Paraglaciecola hydrolytica]